MANNVRIAALSRLAILLLVPALLALAIGWAIAGLGAGALALAIMCGLLLLLFRVRDRVALALLRAHHAPPTALLRIRPLLAETLHQAVLCTPQVYVIDDLSASACAVGGNHARNAVVVTTGLLAHLGDRELRAVLAAEVAQLARRDNTPAVFAVALAGVLLLPVTLLRWGRPSRWDGADRHQGSSLVYAALLVLVPLNASLEDLR